jgi:YVTN family beta-propeller protein
MHLARVDSASLEANNCSPLLRIPLENAAAFVILFGMLAFLSSHLVAQDVPPSGTLLSRQAVIFSPASRKLYAVDKAHGAVSVVDSATGAALTVKVGAEPIAIAANHLTGRVYVANAGSGTVTVLDGRSNSVVTTVNVGARPYVLAVNDATNKIYVSNTFSDVLTVIDGVTNTTTTQKMGSADAIITNPNINKIYFLAYEDTNLNALDGARGTLAKVQIGMHLWEMAVNEAASTVYVTHVGNAAVTILDEKTNALQTIATGAFPCAVAVNPLTNMAYVANYGDDSVTIIDGSKHVAVATVHVGKHPQAIAVDPKANLVYTANTHGDSVTVIDGVSDTVISTLNAGKNPYAIAVDPDSGRIVVANLGEPAFVSIERQTVQRMPSH